MKPCILLHICCAPDATAVVERLAADYEVTGYFHNANIAPPEEYALRLANAERVAQAMGFALEPAPYHAQAWEQEVQGLENEPERGRRCAVCFRHNLTAAAVRARELGLAFFTTTLTISPHKSSSLIFEIGKQAGVEQGITFVERDFKKQDGFKRSLELSRNLNLYRQNYCGCQYSLKGAHARTP